MAEFPPPPKKSDREKAIAYLASLTPIKVKTPLEDVLASMRKRSIK